MASTSDPAFPSHPYVVLGASEDDPQRPDPTICVLLATHNRLEVLKECLDSFVRQTAAPESYEIIVVDDASTDGTAEWLRQAKLPITYRFLQQTKAGAGPARNSGMSLTKARLVLFVNDDTIASPGLVQGHVDAHAELRAQHGRGCSVLGSFEQPPEVLDNAFAHMLERTKFVFCYDGLEEGGDVGGLYFYTCNISVAMDDVRAVGGFDPRFSFYGCEDTDLGLRLEHRGCPLIYRSSLRATHRHPPKIHAIQRRQRTTARAYVRLFQKHPYLLERFEIGANTITSMRALQESSAQAVRYADAVATSLAGLDLKKIAAPGGEFVQVSQLVGEALERVFKPVNNTWWLEGYGQGLEELGLSGFRTILKDAPLELTGTDGPITLLRIDAGSRERWPGLSAGWLSENDAGTLLLWPTEEAGIDVNDVARAAEPLVARARMTRGSPGLAVLDTFTVEGSEVRLFGAASRWIPSGSDWDGEIGRGLADELDVAIDDPETLAAKAPWPLLDPSPLRIFAWPEWQTREALTELVQRLEPLLDDPRVCVCLRHDAASDGSLEEASNALATAFADCFERNGAQPSLSVLLETNPLGPDDWPRLARAVDGWLTLPSDDASERAGLASLRERGLPELATADDVRAWIAGQRELPDVHVPRAQRKELSHVHAA